MNSISIFTFFIVTIIGVSVLIFLLNYIIKGIFNKIYKTDSYSKGIIYNPKTSKLEDSNSELDVL